MSVGELLDLDGLLSERRYAEVLTACGAVAAVRSLTAQEHYARGVAWLFTGAPGDAATALAVAAGHPTLGFWANHWLGRALEAIDDQAGAVQAFRCAHRFGREPDTIPAYVTSALRFLGSEDADPSARATVAGDLQDFWVLEGVAGSAGSLSPQVEGLRDEVVKLGRAIAAVEERQRDGEVPGAGGMPAWPQPFGLVTGHAVAFKSVDHVHPRGTVNDNTRSPRFVAACGRILTRRPLRVLDLGCAGGGLVRDFLLSGHRAMGLEGSDASLMAQRAEWRVLTDHLKTCDVTQPFDVLEADGTRAAFDVISAWEVLEHLPEDSLPVFFANVTSHLALGGLFVASVALFEDKDPVSGAAWHVTLQPPDWWEKRMRVAGLETIPSPFQPRDYPRGSGNGPQDWDVIVNPEKGFHIVARQQSQWTATGDPSQAISEGRIVRA